MSFSKTLYNFVWLDAAGGARHWVGVKIICGSEDVSDVSFIDGTDFVQNIRLYLTGGNTECLHLFRFSGKSPSQSVYKQSCSDEYPYICQIALFTDDPGYVNLATREPATDTGAGSYT